MWMQSAGKVRGFLMISGMLVSLASVSWSAEPQAPDFAREIQPVFAKRCYKCHGPNAAEAGLRLSSREDALKSLESGRSAVVPGNLETSELLKRVRSTDETLRMPPEGKPLTPEEIKALEAWIQQGATWSAHWAFEKPRRPKVPRPAGQSWVRNPIDAFVLRGLEAAGLQPAAPVDKVGLIRRAYYNLIGLPPSATQVDAFLADKSPEAFEKVVDQLLESPQYGEKWARHWLDLVRYAETNGYERDGRKDLIWKYRDYVIRAFNQDKPFNRFIMEQLAGDELEGVTGESLTATGFYRLGIWDDEPADRPLARYDYLDDILRTTSETFLGMTVGCARCHNHKIDPIAQKDYYSLLSFFSDISPHGSGKTNLLPVSTARDKAQFDEKNRDKKKREEEWAARIVVLEKEFVAAMAKRYPAEKLTANKPKTPRNQVVLSDSIKQPQVWEYTFEKPANNWFQIAYDDSKWKKGPGGFGTKGTPGSHVRTVWKTPNIWLRKDFGLTEIPTKLVMHLHHDEDAAIYLNGKLVKTLKGYTTDYKSHDISGESLDVLQTGRNTLAIHCRQTGGGQYIDARLVVDYGESSLIRFANKYGKELLGDQKMMQWKQLRQDLLRSQATKMELKSELAMVVAERGRQKTWILQRGNPQLQGEEVGPGFPQVLNPPAATIPDSKGQKTSGKRRVLADWISSPDNPMTARVMVNRLWQHHFGRGIVRTTSDFGFQGSPPTHPELLDWLATEMIERGWRLKSMHKLIMLSNAYQMSSQANAKALASDPENDRFWRFNMRRLTAEEIRDSILVASGAFNDKMFGPSIFPVLPQEVLATASRPGAAWGRSSPEDAVRRSIYIHVKRSLRHPMLANFDAPDTDTSCSVRMTTTVPTQALNMLNSRFLSEQSTRLADRLQVQWPDDLDRQIGQAIRVTTGYVAEKQEIEADRKFVEKLEKQEQLTRKDALKTYCLLVLNANQFIYLD